MSALDELAERDGLIVPLIAGGIEQRNGAVLRFEFFDLPHEFLLVAQFLAISRRKSCPALRVMREPFAQRVLRSDLFHPKIQARSLLGDAARPQTVNQYAKAVALYRQIIDAFDLQHHIFLRHILAVNAGAKIDRVTP